jgi:hypothetical protein
MTIKYLALLVPCILLGGCNDDDTEQPPSAALQEEWNAHCDNLGECPDARDSASCKADYTCIAALMRPDMLAKTVECTSALTCGVNDDACYSLEAQGLQPTVAAAEFSADCMTRKSTCDGAGGGTFSDDYCRAALSIKDSIVEAAADCLTKSCEQITACLKSTFNDDALGCH